MFQRQTDWQAILDRDGPAVWRTLYRLVGNHADADECFQETFMQAVRLSSHGESPDSLRALLLRIATARAIDHLRIRYRRRRYERPVADSEMEASALRQNSGNVAPHAVAVTAELSESLRVALAELPPRQAEAFSLHFLEGWRYQQIASSLGIRVGAVGLLIHRARLGLRKRLASLRPDLAETDPEPQQGT